MDRSAATRTRFRTDPDGDLTLNFVNADVREVIRSVLGQILEVNYAIDPTVQGVITLQTSRPLARESVLPVLEAVLESSGISLVLSQGLYRIVPATNASGLLQAPRLVRPNAETHAGYKAVIIPLRFVSAEALADILEPFAGTKEILRVDSDRNLLIVAGTSRELATIAEIVDIFDVDWFAGMSFAMINLEEAQAQDIVTELEVIFGDGAEGPLAGVVRFIPFERINAILVATPRPIYIERARAWIDRLDRVADTAERRVYVYRVENARATDLATALDALFAGDGRTGTRPTQAGRLAPGRRPATLRSQPRFAARNETRETMQQPTVLRDAPKSDTSFQTERVSRPAQVAAPATPAISVFGGDGENAIRIIADDTNNALLILATPAEYRQIAAALEQLDIMPLQVLIEATIAEVSLNEDLRYGVQWFLESGNHSITLSNLVNGAIIPTFPGFAYTFSGGTDEVVVLDALESVTEVHVLSTPRVLVRDNGTATIEVGDQVPIAVQSVTSVIDPDAPIVNTIEFRDTGVLLAVTPRVNASGLVSLDIEQEVSSAVQTTTSGIDSPTIQQRRIASSVIVHDGETVALGGLIQNDQTMGRDGVPFLSRIPVLGALFGSRSTRLDRTELLVLITPRVIRTREEARRVTDELREKIGVLTGQKLVDPLKRDP